MSDGRSRMELAHVKQLQQSWTVMQQHTVDTNG